jgi:hypothetical protein
LRPDFVAALILIATLVLTTALILISAPVSVIGLFGVIMKCILANEGTIND